MQESQYGLHGWSQDKTDALTAFIQKSLQSLHTTLPHQLAAKALFLKEGEFIDIEHLRDDLMKWTHPRLIM